MITEAFEGKRREMHKRVLTADERGIPVHQLPWIKPHLRITTNYWLYQQELPSGVY